MEGRVTWIPDDPDKFRGQVERWREAGATHLTVNTMGTGQRSLADHLDALGAIATLLALGP